MIHTPRGIARALGCFTPFAILLGAIFLLHCGSDLGLMPGEWRPGIGDADQAQTQIQTGMTRDEVRAALGRPHRDRGDEWDYWSDRWFVDTVLRVRFGGDGRVASTEAWVN